MLDVQTRQRIDTARDILVGKVPDPKSQVEQITLALMYKFMDDMDAVSEDLGGNATFFSGDFQRYSWRNIVGPRIGGHDTLNRYSEGIARMGENPQLPALFRSIFNNAYLPYRDPETLRSFLMVIDEFDYDNSERLGDAFEYLLSIMGSQGDAGQFRTPRHIIDFIVEIVDPRKDDTILDPACGTAGFLISAYKHINKASEDAGTPLNQTERVRLANHVKGYDISPDMVRLSLVNLYLHNFPDPDIFEYDTLTSEDRWGDYANVILANPPFMSPKGGIRPHNRFSVKSRRSEVLFVDYIAEHLTADGRAGVIVPEGIIFQSQNAHKQLRKMLVEDYLVAVVSLPPGVFNPYSGVKTSVLILDKALARRSDTIGFFKVENDGFDLGAQRRPIDRNDLPQVKQDVTEYLRRLRSGGSVDEFEIRSGSVALKETIAEDGEFSLSGTRYADSVAITSDYPFVPVDRLFNRSRETVTPASLNAGVTYIGLENLEPHTGRLTGELIAENPATIKSSKNVFSCGDVLYGKLRPNLNKVWLADRDGICSSDIFVIKPTDGESVPRFFEHLFRSKRFNDEAVKRLSGAQLPRISWKSLASIKVPSPPLEVQREIVSEIEGYQRVINGARAVVENWRPRIAVDPEWPLVAIKEVCTVNPKKSELNGFAPQALVSFVPMADVEEHAMHIRPRQERDFSEVSASYSYFRDDDVLVARVTPCFENGKAGIATSLLGGVGFGSSEFHVLRSRGEVLPEWVYLSVMEPRFKARAVRNMTGTGGLQRVPRRFVEDYRIAVPSLGVQSELVAGFEGERKMVNGNRKLIERMESKVRDVVGKVWDSS